MYLKLERKAKERYWYNLNSLIIHGNGLLSLLLINSMLMPRHVRWTMLFTNVLLNFFWCALIYKNSRQELLLPETVRFLILIQFRVNQCPLRLPKMTFGFQLLLQWVQR